MEKLVKHAIKSMREMLLYNRIQAPLGKRGDMVVRVHNLDVEYSTSTISKALGHMLGPKKADLAVITIIHDEVNALLNS